MNELSDLFPEAKPTAEELKETPKQELETPQEPADEKPEPGAESARQPEPEVTKTESPQPSEEASVNISLEQVNQYLSDQLGDGMTFDEIKGHLDRAAELRQANESLSEKLKPYEGLDDFGQKLFEAQKAGLNLSEFAKIQNIDVEKMSDADAARFSLSKKFPNLDQESIDLYLESEYGVGMSEEDMEIIDDRKLKMMKVNLKIAAGEGRELVADLKAKPIEHKTAEPQEDPKKVALINQYQTAVQGIGSSIKEIKLKTNNDESFGFEVDPDKMSDIIPVAKNLAESGFFDVPGVKELGRNAIPNLIEGLYYAINKDAITTALSDNVRSKTAEAKDAEYNNEKPIIGSRTTVLENNNPHEKAAAALASIL